VPISRQRLVETVKFNPFYDILRNSSSILLYHFWGGDSKLPSFFHWIPENNLNFSLDFFQESNVKQSSFETPLKNMPKATPIIVRLAAR
jgi:hypothetical protein